jgi:hypothetical protein
MVVNPLPDKDEFEPLCPREADVVELSPPVPPAPTVAV